MKLNIVIVIIMILHWFSRNLGANENVGWFAFGFIVFAKILSVLQERAERPHADRRDNDGNPTLNHRTQAKNRLHCRLTREFDDGIVPRLRFIGASEQLRVVDQRTSTSGV